MPPSEQALDDLRPSDNGTFRTSLRGPFTLGIITANPTPECVYRDTGALHKYGIASEHVCGVAAGLGGRWHPNVGSVGLRKFQNLGSVERLATELNCRISQFPSWQATNAI